MTVRDLAARFLRSAGYTVVTAAGGVEALSLIERQAEPVHLMRTDVVMPEMAGSDLAARMARVHPDVKVLYMSGYTDDAIFRHGVFDSTALFIGKSYTRDQLTRKVREALDAAAPRRGAAS